MSDTSTVAPGVSDEFKTKGEGFFGETGFEAPESVVEKIKRTTRGVFERHGVLWKRGGGRPRKDGAPGKLDTPVNAPVTALPLGSAAPVSDPAPGLDPVLVRRCCTAVVKAFKGFFDKALFRKAQAKYPDDPKFCQELVTDTTITQEEADGFSELAEICLRKYGVGTEYAPEIGLGAIVLGIGVRYAAAFKGLEIKKEEKPDRPTAIAIRNLNHEAETQE